VGESSTTEPLENSPPPGPNDAAEGPAQLRDGQPVLIRRMIEEDRTLVEEFVSRLSESSLAVRFFAPVPRSTAFVELWKSISSPERCALVMLPTDQDRSAIVAHAEFVRDASSAPAAEVAFLVEDAYQGHGCATLLLWRLARAARAVGVREFHAAVLMENDLMLEVFRGCGYPIEEWWGPDAVQVTFPISKRFEPAFPRPPRDSAPA
jgi:GNAT superfamily N-acetyltransferase